MYFYQIPPSYYALERKIQQLQIIYPNIRRVILGKSLLGRNIYGCLLGNEKKLNLMAGAFHGQEWLTASLLLLFMENLCQEIKSGIEPITTRLERKGVLIIPMVNPDGCEIGINGVQSAGNRKKDVLEMMRRDPRSWQANARGVDLNHNFDAGFCLCKEMEQKQGIRLPGPRQYGGAFPHSEPETQAIVRACENYLPDCVFAFHSQGEEIFYRYGIHTPKRSEEIAKKISQLTGYIIKEQTGLASHGGFKDWFIETYHKPGFTIEIGKGENPLPINDLPQIYRSLKKGMIFMCGA